MKFLLLWKCFFENVWLYMYYDWENIFVKIYFFFGYIFDMLEFKIIKWNWIKNDSLYLLG